VAADSFDGTGDRTWLKKVGQPGSRPQSNALATRSCYNRHHQTCDKC
jgi:hypothetical protein